MANFRCTIHSGTVVSGNLLRLCDISLFASSVRVTGERLRENLDLSLRFPIVQDSTFICIEMINIRVLIVQ